MKCPKCNFENLDSAKFCEECGANVDIECPNCGNVVLKFFLMMNSSRIAAQTGHLQ